MIPKIPPCNDPFINPTQLSSVRQQSHISSPNTTHELQAIQYNNTTNKLPLRYKGYADMNPHLLSVHNHQVILEKLKQEKILTMMNMWKKKITTMLIVMNLILMTINNSYFMFNIFWKATGGTDIIACKTPTNVISSVSLP